MRTQHKRLKPAIFPAIHGTAVVLMLEDSSKKVSWGARFSHDSLQDKDIAGLSVIDASTLMPATVHVWARNDSSIVK